MFVNRTLLRAQRFVTLTVPPFHFCITSPPKRDRRTTSMSSRAGGKQKPLKAPKKDKTDLDDEDLAFKEKQKQQAKAQAELVAKLKK